MESGREELGKPPRASVMFLISELVLLITFFAAGYCLGHHNGYKAANEDAAQIRIK
jgi:hypothetical protein